MVPAIRGESLAEDNRQTLSTCNKCRFTLSNGNQDPNFVLLTISVLSTHCNRQFLLFDRNFKGTFECMWAATTQMIDQEPNFSGLRTRIIKYGSVFGSRGFTTSSPYAASKAGIMGMTRSTVVNLSPYEKAASVVCPGCMVTDRTKYASEEVL